MTFRYFFTLCLLWSTAWGLLGCGGGAGTDVAGGTNATSPVQAGVYYDGSSGHDFWGVITPNGRWYGLNYKTAFPDIYSGELTGAGNLNASVSALKYQTTTNTFLQGTASFTSSGPGKLYGALSLNTPSAIPVVFNAANPTGFLFSQGADLSAVSGNWTGKLSSNVGEFEGFSISITQNSGGISHSGSFANCQWNASSSAATALTTANIFTLTLNMMTIGSTTGCDTNLDGKTLTGVAFVTPMTGNMHRLIWVATTSDGHAISFKADR